MLPKLPLKALFIFSFSNHRILFSELKELFQRTTFISFENINDPSNSFKFKRVDSEYGDNTNIITFNYDYDKNLFGDLGVLPSYKYMLKIKPEVQRAIEIISPDLIFLGNDGNLMERLVTHIAKNLQIKTIFIPDGYMTMLTRPSISNNIKEFISYHLKWAVRYLLDNIQLSYMAPRPFALGTTDYVLLWGENSKTLLDKFNRRGKKLICGNTRFDKYLFDNNFLSDIKETVKYAIKKDESKITIVYFTTNMNSLKKHYSNAEQVQLQQIQSLIQYIDFDKYQLFIKPHPQDPEVQYEIYSDKANIIPRDQNFDSMDILAITDICITNISGVLLEALIMKKLSVMIRKGYRHTPIDKYFNNIRLEQLICLETDEHIRLFMDELNNGKKSLNDKIDVQQKEVPISKYYYTEERALCSIYKYFMDEFKDYISDSSLMIE